MSQFHIVLKDYENWKMDNVTFIEQMKSDGTILYRRIEPVYAVLDKIYAMSVKEENIDEDLEIIFQIGFNYLHGQITLIRLYRDKLFGADHERFVRFSPLLGYLLSIHDIRSDLENHEEELDFSRIDDVESLIETMIAEGDTRFDYAGDRLKKAVDELTDVLDSEYAGTVDIFVEIARNLGIGLTEGETYVVGRDL